MVKRVKNLVKVIMKLSSVVAVNNVLQNIFSKRLHNSQQNTCDKVIL